jgi:hypothetical protein
MENYSLEIVSVKDTKSNVLKKYNLNHEDTVGVLPNEPFEILFKNKTWYPVQVKISIDGTCTLSGELANTKIDDKMWFVGGNKELRLKCWPENSQGGSQFVFTEKENSVAKHTHGNMSSQGIIAAAVFVESQPIVVNYQNILRSSDLYKGNLTSSSLNADMERLDIDRERAVDDRQTKGLSSRRRSLTKSAAVGAGETIEQKIETVAGLKQPVFSSVVMVRYEFWDSLKAKLGKMKSHLHPGFPGDDVATPIMSLGSTPKVKADSDKVKRDKQEVSRYL